MKKPTLCILVFLFIFAFLSACAPSPPPEIQTHIDSPFTAEYRELKLEGIIISSPEGQMYLEISTPDELSGLSYSWEDSFTIGYNGLNAMTETDYLPETNFAEAVKNVIADIQSTLAYAEIGEDGTYLYKGSTDSGMYTVYTDKDGNIQTIEIHDIGLKVNIDYS